VGSCLSLDLAVETNDSADIDKGGLVSRGAGHLQSLYDALNIIAPILHIDNIPPASAHLGVYVFGIRKIDRAIAGNLVVIVHDCQVVQLPVASQ
jgi:hypothetical protein